MSESMNRPIRIAIVQRVVTPYRLDLFRVLAARDDVEIRVYYGDDLPASKVRSKPEITGIDAIHLRTRFFRLWGRVLPWHRGLYGELAHWSPDAIVSEAESHFFGYLVCALYRRLHPECRLVHWSLGGLPGTDSASCAIRGRLKRFGRGAADHFFVYSSFGKHKLIEDGHDAASVSVGVNVSDTRRHLEAADALDMSREVARRTLGLDERFTVLTIGALDANKRLDLLLDTARLMQDEPIQFVVLGSGGILPELEERARTLGLGNVSFPGRVSDGLDIYYRAGDALLLPGRGGMVISEAMAHALPVVVHEADGTEYDLVEHGVTGVRCSRGSGEAYATALRTILDDPDLARRWGEEGQRRVRTRFTLESLADQLVYAASENGTYDVAAESGR